MNTNEERIARTEALFRAVNERIAEVARRFHSNEVAFVCECSDEACTELIDASLSDYERARAHATHFVMHPGHEDTRVERVVEVRGERLAIVEKFNHAIARAVRRLNPRSEPT